MCNKLFFEYLIIKDIRLFFKTSVPIFEIGKKKLANQTLSRVSPNFVKKKELAKITNIACDVHIIIPTPNYTFTKLCPCGDPKTLLYLTLRKYTHIYFQKTTTL